MKFIRRVVVLLTMVLSLCAFSVQAEEEEKPTASADISVLSKYIWRGYELSDDSLVVQPSVTVGYKGFSMNVWGNLDSAFDDRDPLTDDESDWTETDLTLSYDRSFGPVSAGVGYIYYSLRGADTQEVYLKAGLKVPLSPTITVYKDIAEFNGWYINLGLSHSFALPENISLDLSGGVGYYYSTDNAFVRYNNQLVATTERYRTMHDGVLKAGLTIPLNKHLSLKPSLTYSFPLSDNADNLLTATSFSGRSDFLYGGITLSLGF